MEADHLPGPPSRDLLEHAALLHAWKLGFGSAWHGTAAVAGTALIRQVARGPYDKVKQAYSQVRWQLPDGGYEDAWMTAPQFTGMNHEPPNPARGRYRHVFDVNRQWITAAAQTPVAYNRLAHTGAVAFDAKRAGMWLVRVEPWTRGDILPDPAGPRVGKSGLVWMSTPRLALIHALAQREDEYAHMGYKVVDSWTERGHLVLKPWAESLKTLYADPDLEPAAKRVYAKTLTNISNLSEHGKRRVFRPDWSTAVLDTAQANLWRKLLACGLQSGRWPVKVSADQPAYASDELDWRRDVPAGLELSDQAGKLKFRETLPEETAA
jgi:hypothetical protein